jgi:hypothetical protein
MGGTSTGWKNNSYDNPYRETYKGSDFSTNMLDKAMARAGIDTSKGYDLVLELGHQIDSGKIERVGAKKNKYISGDEFTKAADTLNDAMDGKKRATKTVMRVMTEMMRRD